MAKEIKPATMFYRCLVDHRLLRDSDILTGQCAGHRIIYASHGSFLEWLKVKWWRLKELING